MSTQIDRLTELAKGDPKRQFYSIAHMITVGTLYTAFRGLRKKASATAMGSIGATESRNPTEAEIPRFARDDEVR